MITGELKSQIDKVWEAFWTGGLSNPITVIEQMTYLLFIRRLDELQTQKESKANLLKKPIEDPLYSTEEHELRWSHFKNMDPEVMHRMFTKDQGVFDFLRNVGNRSAAFSKFMKGATFMIPTPRLLAQVVEMISNIDMSDRDTKGDVYEYLLSKIASAGQNGQFRTPRHIIRMMVDMVQPTLEDVICDPSCGTAGFLTVAGEYIREHFEKDLYTDSVKKHFQEKMFMGMEFDPTMIRIGGMNLMLHGIENPQLIDVDALSEANTSFSEKATLVLANPPFKGSLDREAVDGKILAVVDSKKTELLFLALILKGLKLGGRCAVIVPDGVLFGSSKAHLQIRKELIDRQKLQAVISMPSGVFKPYAGVSTAVLVFTKTNSGGTDKVWFYNMQADGLSLDDKRQPIEANDIPDIVNRYQNLKAESKSRRTDKSFMVPVKEIQDNKYDLSINRYKEVVYEEKTYKKPTVIISQIEAIDKERAELLNQLKKDVGMSWKKVALSEIMDLQNGFAFNSEDYVESSNVYNCRMSNIRPGGDFDIDYNPRFLPDEFAIKYSQFLLKEGDIIVAMTDLANDPKILGIPTIVNTNKKILLNQRVGKLIVKDEKRVFIPFLKYALNRKEVQKYFAKFSSGGLQINLGKNDLLSYTLSLPLFPIQKRIAEILDAADALKRKDQQLLQKYDELAQAIFIDMFGDPVKNEKGWEVKTIEQLVKKTRHSIKRGPFGGALKKEIFVSDGYLVYEQFHALNNDFTFGRYYINQEKYDELIAFDVKPKDIIISCSGIYLGKLAIVPEGAKAGIINQALLKLTLDENIYKNEFFVKVFTQENFKETYFASERGAAIPNFPPMSTFKDFKFICPPIKIQNEYLKLVQNLQNQIDIITTEQKTTDNLFQTLIQKAFKGELVA